MSTLSAPLWDRSWSVCQSHSTTCSLWFEVSTQQTCSVAEKRWNIAHVKFTDFFITFLLSWEHVLYIRSVTLKTILWDNGWSYRFMADHDVSWLIIFFLSQGWSIELKIAALTKWLSRHDQAWSTLIKHNRWDLFSVHSVYSFAENTIRLQPKCSCLDRWMVKFGSRPVASEIFTVKS